MSKLCKILDISLNNINLKNSSTQQYLEFTNNSTQQTITLDGGSYQSSLTFSNYSTQQYIVLDSGSHQDEIRFDESSQINLNLNGYFKSIKYNQTEINEVKIHKFYLQKDSVKLEALTEDPNLQSKLNFSFNLKSHFLNSEINILSIKTEAYYNSLTPNYIRGQIELSGYLKNKNNFNGQLKVNNLEFVNQNNQTPKSLYLQIKTDDENIDANLKEGIILGKIKYSGNKDNALSYFKHFISSVYNPNLNDAKNKFNNKLNHINRSK